MRRSFLLVAGSLSVATAGAQDVRIPVSQFYPGLQAYSSRFVDAFSFRANAAALAVPTQFSVGLFSERRFLLQDLGHHALAAVVPTNSGNIGFTADYSGNALLNQSVVGLAYGRKLGNEASVGARFTYTYLSAAGYGAAGALGFDVGFLLRLAEGVQGGLQASNPVRPRIGKGEERLPAIYSLGIGYDASPQLHLAAELQKVEDETAGVNVGLQYLLADKLVARVGLRSATATFYFGFGFRWKALRLDLTAALHPSLGTTPGLLLLYSPQP